MKTKPNIPVLVGCLVCERMGRQPFINLVNAFPVNFRGWRINPRTMEPNLVYEETYICKEHWDQYFQTKDVKKN